MSEAVATEDFSDAATWEEPSDGRSDGSLGIPPWKGKGKEILTLSDSAIALPDMLEGVDEDEWMKYEPPVGLKTAPPGIDSDIILRVIQESIERIKIRITEDEERRRTETEAAKVREEEAARQESDKGKQPEVSSGSVDAVDDAEPVQPPSPSRNPYAYAMSKKTLRVDPHGLLVPAMDPPKPKKRSLFALLKRLNRSGEREETSAAGAARHRHTVSSSSIDLTGRTRSALGVLKKAAGGSSPKTSIEEDVIVECVSCLDDFSSRDTIRAPCHNYCRPCFRRLITAACTNEQQWPPKCCLNRLPDSTVLLGLAGGGSGSGSGGLFEQWRDRGAEWDIPVADRVYCSSQGCGLWVRPYQISAARREARCSAGHWTCTICRGRQHDGEACPQDRDLLRTNELAEEEGWKRCHGCGAYVEHREACQHMTCRCGAEFCYVCGAVWRTCGCTMEQLAAVKRDAEARRQARADRDAAEEAELQEALRLVAEFEREEALKAELLRRERRRRALEARLRREEARRAAVGLEFARLRGALAGARAAQREAVARDHAGEEGALARREEAEAGALGQRREEEREALERAAAAELAELEAALDAEYGARAAEERRVGEEYAARLKAYWERRRERERRRKEKQRQKGKGKGNEVDADVGADAGAVVVIIEDDIDSEAEKAVRAALAEFQKRMDRGFEAWQKRAAKELEQRRHDGREEVAIREELFEEAVRRLAQSRQEERAALARRARAELRWVEAAVEEGVRLLAEIENEELEEGNAEDDVESGDDEVADEDVELWFMADDGTLFEDAAVNGDGGNSGGGGGGGLPLPAPAPASKVDGDNTLDEYTLELLRRAQAHQSQQLPDCDDEHTLELLLRAYSDSSDLREFAVPGAFMA